MSQSQKEVEEQIAFDAMYNITIAYWSGLLTKEQIADCETIPQMDWRHAIREANDPDSSKEEWVEFVNMLSDAEMQIFVEMYVADTGWKFESTD